MNVSCPGAVEPLELGAEQRDVGGHGEEVGELDARAVLVVLAVDGADGVQGEREARDAQGVVDLVGVQRAAAVGVGVRERLLHAGDELVQRGVLEEVDGAGAVLVEHLGELDGRVEAQRLALRAEGEVLQLCGSDGAGAVLVDALEPATQLGELRGAHRVVQLAVPVVVEAGRGCIIE